MAIKIAGTTVIDDSRNLTNINSLAEATWEAGVSTTETVVSPAKVKAAIDAVAPTQVTATWEAGTDTTESLVSAAKVKAAIDALATVDVGAETAALSAGAVGTYVFAVSTTASDVSYGSTRAGSALRPTSAVQSGDLDFADPFTFAEGSALSGTWRCMGTYDYVFTGTGIDSGKNIYSATLWLRIS